MSKTLYLVRRPLREISPSIFVPSETEGDVLLIEAAVASGAHTGGRVFSVSGENTGSKRSFDEVISMLFEYERVIVL